MSLLHNASLPRLIEDFWLEEYTLYYELFFSKTLCLPFQTREIAGEAYPEVIKVGGAWARRFLLEVENLGTDIIEKVKNELKDMQYLKAFWTSIIHQQNQ
ncbi:hypothetical protein Glove_48g49 [Diversispora epigaea]|uniref:Uncharacterized protein n=1 Tax=Diversispora epigaea TaxID=1348612 RepID=A0A397JH96_9GLOM|nr:hypothetical protein Glove_48g49 [Diversispora epigaea]